MSPPDQYPAVDLEQLHHYRHLCVERLGRICVERNLLDQAYRTNMAQLIEINDNIRELSNGDD